MSPTITDEATCALARELAELTGETVTEAVTVALREHLERHREVEARIDDMMGTAERVAGQLRDGPSAVDIGDVLYDERGLPK